MNIIVMFCVLEEEVIYDVLEIGFKDLYCK